MNNIQRIKNRFLLLNTMYELSKDDPRRIFDEEELCSLLEFTENEVDLILDYLKNEGLVDHWANGAFAISHQGKKKIESGDKNIEYLSGVTPFINVVNNSGAIYGLQQGNSNSKLTISIPSESKETLDEIVASLKALKNTLELIPEVMDEFIIDIQTLELQKNSPKPKTNIIREALTSVRTIVEGAAGGVASTLATEANLLQKIETVIKSLS